MRTTYILNGVPVDQDTYRLVMDGNPDNFNNRANFNDPQIPDEHKQAYARDVYNERMGRGQVFWTPMRRWLDALARQEAARARTKAARRQKRQAQLAAQHALNQYQQELAQHAEFVAECEANQKQQQAREDSKSALLMTAIFAGACLLLTGLAMLAYSYP